MAALADKPDLISRMLRPEAGGFSQELAAYILNLNFTEEEHARIDVLARKCNQGTLSAEERAEYEWYVIMGDFINLIQIKARISLKKHQPAA
jgi:hypothetical protein